MLQVKNTLNLILRIKKYINSLFFFEYIIDNFKISNSYSSMSQKTTEMANSEKTRAEQN